MMTVEEALLIADDDGASTCRNRLVIALQLMASEVRRLNAALEQSDAGWRLAIELAKFS